MTTTANTVSTLTEQLEDHAGEMILVVTRRWVFSGLMRVSEVVEPRSDPYRLDADFKLGIIAEPFVQVGPGSMGAVTFFVEGMRYWSVAPCGKVWELWDARYIVLVRHTLEDLGRPIYSPDERRAVYHQKRLEDMGWADQDLALEIVIGNDAVEKHLTDRIKGEYEGPYIPRAHGEERAVLESERKRKVFPQQILDQALELSGIAEQRRQAAAELLEVRRSAFLKVIAFEVEARLYNLTHPRSIAPTHKAVFHSRFCPAVSYALEVGSHTLETCTFEIGGLVLTVENPLEFMRECARHEEVPFPDEDE